MLLNVYVREPQEPAQACVIWMHGLGADAQDMMGLATQLPLTIPLRHVFLDAPVRPVTLNNHMPMRAWYDILGMKLTDREDSKGIKSSEVFIREVIDTQLAEGFVAEQIFLAGFSQGGAMALYTGIHTSMPLAGIIALSGYLPLASASNIVLNQSTPMFIASGLYDPLVLPTWTKQCIDLLHQKGFKKIASHEYPMEHTICADEIRDLAGWLTTQVTSMTHQEGVK